MYTEINFKTKKQFKEAIASGRQVYLICSSHLHTPVLNGREFVEGPHYPAIHTWYAQVEMKDGIVVSVK